MVEEEHSKTNNRAMKTFTWLGKNKDSVESIVLIITFIALMYQLTLLRMDLNIKEAQSDFDIMSLFMSNEVLEALDSASKYENILIFSANSKLRFPEEDSIVFTGDTILYSGEGEAQLTPNGEMFKISSKNIIDNHFALSKVLGIMSLCLEKRLCSKDDVHPDLFCSIVVSTSISNTLKKIIEDRPDYLDLEQWLPISVDENYKYKTLFYTGVGITINPWWSLDVDYDCSSYRIGPER